jgi:hypothetical protein
MVWHCARKGINSLQHTAPHHLQLTDRTLDLRLLTVQYSSHAALSGGWRKGMARGLAVLLLVQVSVGPPGLSAGLESLHEGSSAALAAVSLLEPSLSIAQ